MGGILIKEIIEEKQGDRFKQKSWFYSLWLPKKSWRKYLVENGFQIIEEDLAQEDQRIYQIIIAKKGKTEPWSDIDYHISPYLVKQTSPSS